MQYYNSETVLYLDGEFIKSEAAKIDLYSQSLHYGYAVFEGIRAYNTHNGTRIFKAKAHYKRLKESCDLVNIPFIWDIDDLIEQTYRLLEMNGFRDAYIRPLVYCAPNMALTEPLGVSILICAWEWEAYFGDKQVRVCVSNFQRPNPKSTPIAAKVSGHYVNSILATTEAKKRGYDEAILLDQSGFVAEAPGANIFIEKGGKLYTPTLGNILPGITRATLIQLCKRLDIECVEQQIGIAELKSADSAFLCGTAAEIIGITSVDETLMPLKWSESLGATLQRTYKNLVLEKQNYEVFI
jgi:branched-chain amino acid aminotransferase